MTAANKYDVVYDDYDEEEMGEADFEIYKMKVKDQVVVKLANAQHARFWKDANDCNCAIGHCYHPWSKNTNGFNRPYVIRCMQETGQLGVPKAREFVEAGNHE